jgi:hypothetical protein
MKFGRPGATFVTVVWALAGLAPAVALGTGCERRVTGETYEGQIAGGRSMRVSYESPPRGATGPGAPKEPPPSTRTWLVRESDPAVQGLLRGAGANLPLRPPQKLRPFDPPPPPAPEPEPESAAAPAAPTAALAPRPGVARPGTRAAAGAATATPPR